MTKFDELIKELSALTPEELKELTAKAEAEKEASMMLRTMEKVEQRKQTQKVCLWTTADEKLKKYLEAQDVKESILESL